MSRFFSSVTEETLQENDQNEKINDESKLEEVKDINLDPRGPRTLVVTPEQSIKYLNSDAYKETYAHHKVWHLFRRNFKGQFSPHRPLRWGNPCITEGYLWTRYPCAVCRDEYLVLHYSNLDLIKQFINPQTGYVYENTVLCLCSEQYEKLLVAVNLAKNYGLLTFELPLRTYDYKEYYKQFQHNHNCSEDKHLNH